MNQINNEPKDICNANSMFENVAAYNQPLGALYKGKKPQTFAYRLQYFL